MLPAWDPKLASTWSFCIAEAEVRERGGGAAEGESGRKEGERGAAARASSECATEGSRDKRCMVDAGEMIGWGDLQTFFEVLLGCVELAAAHAAAAA